MAKLKHKYWIENSSLIFHELYDGFRIDGLTWWGLDSAHGKSRSVVKCPLCNHETIVYNWSFMGSGKRCTQCNVFLGSQGAYIKEEELDKESFIFVHKHLKP